MDKRTIIAVVLSVAFLYAYSFFLPAPKKEIPQNAAVQKSLSSSAVLPAVKAVEVKSPAVPADLNIVAEEVTVETDLYRVVFSNQGAAVKSFHLKKYSDSSSNNSLNVAVHDADSNSLTLLTESPEIGVTQSMLYRPSQKAIKVQGAQTASLQFTAVTPAGVELQKVYTFTGNSYGIDLQHSLTNRGTGSLTGSLQVLMKSKPSPDSKTGTRYEVQGASVYVDGKGLHLPNKDILKQPHTYKSATWSAYSDKYFIAAVLASQQVPFSSLEVKSDNGLIVNRISLPAVTVLPNQTTTQNQRIYFGPKDIDQLKGQGSHLEEALDLGWFAVLAKPLLLTLKFLYSYVGNYGLAIIIITVILKILFYPLTYKSYKSMKDMQKIQPLMEKLKEKYKNDRTAMNQEVMKLYQEHKVNPLGGCLPMVVQIPVFFALYKALMFSIELRHAPFYLWITDLSAKDPYYVTPIVMGITMFIQQKMTPTNMEPLQARMMLMLPVVFTFMFLSFPSGLVIYWLVNNVLSIGQQYYINRLVAAKA